MGLDPKALMAENGVDDALGKALSAAYQRGYDDALARLMSLAQAAGSTDVTTTPPAAPWSSTSVSGESGPPAVTPVEVQDTDNGGDTSGRRKARRGIVGPTVDAVLKEHPGLTIADYEGLVVQREPEISIKTVGNHLRAGEREGKYRRDKPGGYQWYFVEEENETEPDDFESLLGSASSHSNQEGGDGHGPATT